MNGILSFRKVIYPSGAGYIEFNKELKTVEECREGIKMINSSKNPHD